VGKRGQGRWQKISWKDAVSEVAKTLGDLREKGQSHTVGLISGSDRGTVPRLFERFLTVYGSPNFIRTPSIMDSYELTLHLTQGVQASPGFDFENANFILSFGSGILDGWGSPVRMFRANSIWRDTGAKVIQIEPRLSTTAAKSDKWIPINPGTEGYLALGIAHVIIKESLYDADFIYYYSAIFDDWKRFVLDNCGPDSVATVTGIDSTTIIALARSFARASKPLAIFGRGQGTTPGSFDECAAVHALNALVGNINKHGGIFAVAEPDYINWPEVEMDAKAAAGMQEDRLDDAGSQKYPFSRYLLNRLPQAVNSGKKYPLNTLFVAGANPLYTMYDSKTVKSAFDKIPFIVSFSSYMDETAKNADLVLPNHNYLERYEDIPTPAAAGILTPVIGLLRPVVEPQFNTKHTGDVIILLAKALGGTLSDAFAWDSYNACLKETLGYKWQVMVEKGFWSYPDFVPQPREEIFDTGSGKFEFARKETGSLKPFKPVNIEGDKANYPLLLVPYDSIRLANGAIGDPPFVMKSVDDTVLKGTEVFIEINPKTAGEHGLREGQLVMLSTPVDQAKVKVHLFDGIMPGIVALPRGLGHTAYDEYLAGKGINFNELIGPVEDPVSGLNAAWGIRAKLAKA